MLYLGKGRGGKEYIEKREKEGVQSKKGPIRRGKREKKDLHITARPGLKKRYLSQILVTASKRVSCLSQGTSRGGILPRGAFL